MHAGRLSYILLATGIGVIPCLGSAVSVDGTWYNFWNVSGNNFATNGSSCLSGPPGCTEPYSAPGDPPWTFTVTGAGAELVVTDGGHQGDIFGIFNFNAPLGTTSSVMVDLSHDCGNFPTPCLADPLMSHGSFFLAPGNYSITIQEEQFFEPSFLAWFQVDPLATTTAPEPGTSLLIGSALIGLGILRRYLR